jgi:hypothetical protein
MTPEQRRRRKSEQDARVDALVAEAKQRIFASVVADLQSAGVKIDDSKRAAALEKFMSRRKGQSKP